MLALGAGRSCPCGTSFLLLTVLLSLSFSLPPSLSVCVCVCVCVCGVCVSSAAAAASSTWQADCSTAPLYDTDSNQVTAKLMAEALPLTQAACINYKFMSNGDGWECLVSEQPAGPQLWIKRRQKKKKKKKKRKERERKEKR